MSQVSHILQMQLQANTELDIIKFLRMAVRIWTKEKEEPNEGGLGAVRIDEDCEADDTNGLSIESCLDSHTKPEY